MSSIEVHGLTEVITRMQAYPDKLKAVLSATMDAAMLILWESVPPYPPPPPNSSYDRTGTLGRTLGSSEGGGTGSGHPSIYEVRQLGSGYEGHFGTNLEYAPYVIGDDDQSAFMYHWWQMKDVASAASEKITRVFDDMTAQLKAFLEGG